MSLLKIIGKILGTIFGFIWKIFGKFLELLGLKDLLNVSKGSLFLIPIYFIIDNEPLIMIGGIPHIAAALKAAKIATPYITSYMNSQPQSVYQQSTPDYNQPYNYQQQYYPQTKQKSKLINHFIVIILLLMINYNDSNCDTKTFVKNSGITISVIYTMTLIQHIILNVLIPHNNFISKLIRGISLFMTYNYVVNMSSVMKLNKCK
jgi:hypothetical protein